MKANKTKVLISGSYGTGNVGDEVILACILEKLSHCDVTVLSQGESYTKNHFPGVRVIPQTPNLTLIRIMKDLLRFRFAEIWKRIVFLRELNKADVFWLGGGGLLAEMVPAVLRFYIQQLKLASFFNCKVVTFAVGVGPLKTSEGKELLKKIMDEKVRSISVRDIDSCKLLKDVGVQKDVTVIPDPAFLYKKESQIDQKLVVINFYPVFLDDHVWPGQQYRWQKLKDVLIEATRHIVQELNYKVVYLPFGTQNDLRFAHEMKRDALKAFPVLADKLSVYEGNSFEDITDVLISAKWSLTMRFHAGLISMVNLRPSLCIDQQFKTERVLNSFGLSELLLSLPDGHHKQGNEDIDINVLKSKIEWLESNYSSCCEKLKSNVHSNQEKLLAFYKDLNSFMGIKAD